MTYQNIPNSPNHTSVKLTQLLNALLKKSMYHIILSTSQLYFCFKKNPKWFSHWYRLIVYNKKKRKKYRLTYSYTQVLKMVCFLVFLHVFIYQYFYQIRKKLRSFFFTLCNRKFVNKLHDQQSHYFF